jgi:hypothetical protein
MSGGDSLFFFFLKRFLSPVPVVQRLIAAGTVPLFLSAVADHAAYT